MALKNLFKSKEGSPQKDVSWIHDFIFYLQNAVALEHHAIESYSVTKDPLQMQIAERARTNRSKWMYKNIPESKSQIYCETKHLSACAMALKEMGNRFLTNGNKELADECFTESSDMEAIIVLLNQPGESNNNAIRRES